MAAAQASRLEKGKLAWAAVRMEHPRAEFNPGLVVLSEASGELAEQLVLVGPNKSKANTTRWRDLGLPVDEANWLLVNSYSHEALYGDEEANTGLPRGIPVPGFLLPPLNL